MRRRDFLGAAAAGIGGVMLGCRSDGQDPTTGTPVAESVLAEGRPLRPLDRLRNESGRPGEFSATLVAMPTPMALTSGPATGMWTYNGALPGPLIDLTEGQRVRIRVDNALPADTTIHWHGLPVAPEQDGNPMDPIAAGSHRVYEYDLPAGCAGTYWYHPHPHNSTAQQVASGLAGPMIVRAIDDPLAHLEEVCLFVSGVRLDPDGTISEHSALDWAVGRQPELLLVNGGRLPVHSMRPGATQRWRICNATSAHHFRLSLEGHTLTLVGTDGGLLAAPIGRLSEILIAPAQRFEVLVTLRSTPGARYRLRALRYQTDLLALGTYQDDDLLTVAATDESPALPAFIPPALRPIADTGPATARQRIELDETNELCRRSGAQVAFLINGRIFDPGRVDLTSTVGSIELWDIVNKTGMAHPFHLHGIQFQLVSRQVGTVITPASYLAWIDTVLVPAQHVATIKVRQTQPGKRMFHCHILEHEDACMMGVLEVREA